MELRRYSQDQVYNFPVSGNGTDLVAGAVLNRGTQNGCLRLSSGASTGAADYFAVLREAHTASGNDTTTGGTVFTVRKCELLFPVKVVRAYFSLATTDLITCTSAVTTTSMAVTSLESDITAGFVYVASGTGAGQMNYITASTSGTATLKAAFTTSLDTTSLFVKVLPRFWDVAMLTSDGTKLASQAAAGSQAVMVLDIGMTRDGLEDFLDPTKHSALTGLSGLSEFKVWADIAFRDTAVYTIN